MAEQYYADWGISSSVPELTVSWDEIKAFIHNGHDVRCERFRWVGDRYGRRVLLNLSYLYATVDGERYRVVDFPYSDFQGWFKGFRPWLYKVLNAEGVFFRNAFSNLSILL